MPEPIPAGKYGSTRSCSGSTAAARHRVPGRVAHPRPQRGRRPGEGRGGLLIQSRMTRRSDTQIDDRSRRRLCRASSGETAGNSPPSRRPLAPATRPVRQRRAGRDAMSRRPVISFICSSCGARSRLQTNCAPTTRVCAPTSRPAEISRRRPRRSASSAPAAAECSQTGRHQGARRRLRRVGIARRLESVAGAADHGPMRREASARALSRAPRVMASPQHRRCRSRPAGRRWRMPPCPQPTVAPYRRVALLAAAALLLMFAATPVLAWFKASTTLAGRISTGTWSSGLAVSPGCSRQCIRTTTVAPTTPDSVDRPRRRTQARFRRCEEAGQPVAGRIPGHLQGEHAAERRFRAERHDGAADRRCRARVDRRCIIWARERRRASSFA